MPRLSLPLLSLCAALAAGCGTEPPAAGTPAPPSAPAAPSKHNKDECGAVTGAVTWTGPLPAVEPVLAVKPRADGSGFDTRPVSLAVAPRIDSTHRGLAGAVVYLRGVDPDRAKPWDLPNVEVEFRDWQIVVRQGERAGRTGFVRRGDTFTAVSREPVPHTLRGRGAAFFALPFPDPDKPLTRTLDTAGRVELTSASGAFWQAAELFVSEHPYYAVTDTDGRFRFDAVPEGRYELFAWHPNWQVERTERNPESGQPSRLHFAPPLEVSRAVSVERKYATLANLTLPK